MGRGGQVATFLLLMIVAALIFVMMTANLGQVSLAATRVANAADSSSLLLGSQLATKSRVLGETLGSKGSPAKQKCTSGGGMLGPILAIIIAIIAIVAQQYELFAFLGTILGATTATGMAMTAGAIGGAVGGAIGGGITGGGQGALVGAIQGAITGASIGYGMGSGAGMGGDFFGTAVAGVADAVFVPSAVGAAVGATAGAALSAGSNLYSGSVMDQMREDAIGAAGKKLSGLPEYDRIRETVVQRALMQTVDDPTKIQDNYQGCPDSDEDGNTTEMVPFFQVWWACRTKGIQAVVPVLTSLTQDFLNGPLATFESAAKAAMTPPAGALSRREFEKDASGTGVDGAVVELARALTNKGFALKFWQPGPDPVALDTWNKTDCETCQPPSGFDEVDFAIDTFHDIVDASSGQGDKPGLKGQPIDRVVNTWQTWLKLFYNPAANERGDFYDVLGVIVNGGNEIKGGADVTGMNAWKTEIETIRKGLPQCTYIYSVCDGSDPLCVPGVPVSVQYPLPCRGDGTVIPASGGSIDTDLADEFTPVRQQIDTLIGDIQTFRDGIKDFSDSMKAAYTQLNASGGVNPATYGWTDSRGSHSVQVEVGPFKVAYIKKKTSGSFLKKKICLILTDYSDGGGNAWVKITRQDPSNKGIGFWNWNPHGGTMTKMSRASYSYDAVGIAGTK